MHHMPVTFLYAETLKHGRGQTEGITCAHGSMLHELALSLVLLVSYSMRTADGSEVRPDYRRSSSGRNHMHAWYIRYHKKMPRSSWRKFPVVDTPDSKNWSVYARNTWWRRTRPKHSVLEVLSLKMSTYRSLFFFREEIEFVETEIRAFADWNHNDRELKRRRHHRSLYSWCTRRMVVNEASARRNLLALLREKRTTYLSVGV